MFCRAIGARHRRACLAEHSRSFVSDDGRREALSQFFQLVETRFGNIKSLMDEGSAAETIVSDELRPEHLARLLAHDATALHVRNFYERGTAIRIGNDLIEESVHNTNNWRVSTSRGLESSDVGTLGMHSPFNVATAKARQLNQGEGIDPVNEYFEGVQAEFKIRRRMPASARETGQYYQFWPLDKLRLELEESWPSGAGLAREEATKSADKPYPRPFGGGLPRIMKGPTRWKRGFIHVDELGPLDPFRGLFSANIYLKMPEIGDAKKSPEDAGSLYVWPLGVRSRLDWYRNAVTMSSLSAQDAASQIDLWHSLGQPNVIRPEPGDLVMLCTQRPHCAVGFGTGTRVSLQCFIQFDGPDKRLLIDC